MRLKRIPFALLAGLLLVFACETPEQPEEQVVPDIKVSSESQSAFSSGIDFGASSGSQTQSFSLTFTATDAWQASVVQTKAPDWVSVQPASGNAGTVNMTVTVQPNPGEADREAVVTLTCGNVRKSFTVRQAGTPPVVVAVTGITLDRTSVSLTEGQQVTLTATVEPADATDKTVTWTTSNSGVATVDQNGTVTAVAEGTATITAAAGDKSATCAVTVQKNVVAVTGITLDRSSVSLTEGQQVTLTATVEPADATDKTVTWTTSNSGVATVDQNGTVTAVAEGTATITAKAGDKSATCAVTVKKNTMSGDNEGTGTEDWD